MGAKKAIEPMPKPKKAEHVKFPKRIYLVEYFEDGEWFMYINLFGDPVAFTSANSAKKAVGGKIKLRSYVVETGVRVGGK